MDRWSKEFSSNFRILLAWKFYANLFNDVLDSPPTSLLEQQREAESAKGGLRCWMLNLPLMIINELLMEKSLIICIISRLIFFPGGRLNFRTSSMYTYAELLFYYLVDKPTTFLYKTEFCIMFYSAYLKLPGLQRLRCTSPALPWLPHWFNLNRIP